MDISEVILDITQCYQMPNIIQYYAKLLIFLNITHISQFYMLN